MERFEKEKQAEIRSYKGLMVQDKMTSNKQVASGSKTLQELEEDFMWGSDATKSIAPQELSKFFCQKTGWASPTFKKTLDLMIPGGALTCCASYLMGLYVNLFDVLRQQLCVI